MPLRAVGSTWPSCVLLFSSFVATATMEVALIVSGLQGICSTIPMLAKSVP